MRILSLTMLLALAITAGAADAKPEAPRIAVLRLEEAMLAFKGYNGGMEALKKDVAEGQAQIKKMEEKLQELDSKLQVLQQDSPAFAKTQEEFETLNLRRKMTVERGNQDIARRRAKLLKDGYAGLRVHLKSFCQERGIKLVHLAPNPELQGTDNKELNLQLFTQGVLYYDTTLDITEAFVPYLNERWSAGDGDLAPKAEPAVPAPAPAPPAAPEQPAAK